MMLTVERVNEYIKQLSGLTTEHESKHQAISLLHHLINAISENHIQFPDLGANSVERLLGYGLNYKFDEIRVSQDNIYVCLILNKLIGELENSSPVPENKPLNKLRNLLIQYKTGPLNSAIIYYKKCLLGIGNIKAVNTFALGRFDHEFNVLCNDIDRFSVDNQLFSTIRANVNIEYNKWKIHFSATNDNNNVDDQFWEFVCRQSTIESEIKPLQDQNPGGRFYFKITLLKYKSTISVDDILELKDSAEAYKEYLLEAPETYQVRQYNAIINALCNFINACSYCIFSKRPFISSQSQNIHHFFNRLERVFEESEHHKNTTEEFIPDEMLSL